MFISAITPYFSSARPYIIEWTGCSIQKKTTTPCAVEMRWRKLIDIWRMPLQRQLLKLDQIRTSTWIWAREGCTRAWVRTSWPNGQTLNKKLIRPPSHDKSSQLHLPFSIVCHFSEKSCTSAKLMNSLEWQIVLKAGARVHAEQKFIYQHQSEISSEMIVANE